MWYVVHQIILQIPDEWLLWSCGPHGTGCLGSSEGLAGAALWPVGCALSERACAAQSIPDVHWLSNHLWSISHEQQLHWSLQWVENLQHSPTHQLESRMWCSVGEQTCLMLLRWWSCEGRRGPGEPGGEVGRACRRACGLSAGSWWPLSPEEKIGFWEQKTGWWSCRTPCWHRQRRWWRWAAPADDEAELQHHSWEQSGRKACNSGPHYEDQMVGSSKESCL